MQRPGRSPSFLFQPQRQNICMSLERNRHGTRIVAEDIATSWRNCSFLLHPPPSADTRCPHHHPFVSSMQMTSRFGRDARGSSSSGGRINSRAWDSLAPRFLSMAAPQRFGKKK
ncbi:pro-FMRFamide-related neuropeptide FF isoform X6 [Hemicordylus capensis]|uniref:pro-FMRFamide-related neuropeptide FF isoform X6 n=1 Tax=Hemicordylus capensis TaxID=884348 RepID=UPI002303BC69|nr:pro-FMRFamide-related neuropeptide FF isoform X6 [Hemicordylus capensis]XP_053152580.1 pro-FMRFamide-related neuropeptide FF isoform X6 [Hemicordylus capensis]